MRIGKESRYGLNVCCQFFDFHNLQSIQSHNQEKVIWKYIEDEKAQLVSRFDILLYLHNTFQDAGRGTLSLSMDYSKPGGDT